jgi:hypothetical protein
MKSFKSYGHGGKAGFDFSTKKGFTGSSGKVQSVRPFTRKSPMRKAKGGFCEGGPMYGRGGMAKPPMLKAEGGAIKAALATHIRSPKPAGHGVRSYGGFNSKPLVK